jgi:mono/diheme cytochrome c family protein
MRVLRTSLSVAALFLLGACATAASRSAGRPSSAAQMAPDSALQTPESIAEGSRIYHTAVCVTCHAPNAGGGLGGPNLSDRDWLQINGNYASIVAIIKNGVALPDIREGSFQRPMPPRGERTGQAPLTDEQIDLVAAYIWSLSNRNQ